MKKNLKLKANMSMTLVLIIMAVLISAGIVVLLTSVDLANSTKDSFNLYLNEMRSRSCVEEGLNKIKNNTGYTGTLTISYTDGSCSVEISNDPQNVDYKIFNVNSTVGTYNYSLSKKVDISQEPNIIID